MTEAPAMSESEVAAPPIQPLFYRSLQFLDARSHGALRLKGGDYAFAAGTPSIPIVVSEFAEVSRHYPIVFGSGDATPFAVLGIDRRNLFQEDGRWASGVYVPAYARRYPFGFLRIDDTSRYILGIDLDCANVTETEGEPLFEDGRPSAVTQRALGFCEAFQAEAEATIAFMRALEGRDLLVDRRADAVTPDGRSFALDGFRVVDKERYDALDGPTLAEWHMRGWLSLVTLHLTSLSRFQDLLTRRGTLSDGTPAAGDGDVARLTTKES